MSKKHVYHVSAFVRDTDYDDFSNAVWRLDIVAGNEYQACKRALFKAWELGFDLNVSKLAALEDGYPGDFAFCYNSFGLLPKGEA